jgi:predicted nucleic acid-binding protein
VDSCVLIAAYQGTQEISSAAMAVLDDPDRQFVVSSYVELEVLPKPLFYNRAEEVAFMRQFFGEAAERIETSQEIICDAVALAAKYDLSPIDALHASIARTASVDELVTLEGCNKPLLRVSEPNVVTLREPS